MEWIGSFFYSLGVDGRCLKQRWWARLPGVHGMAVCAALTLHSSLGSALGMRAGKQSDAASGAFQAICVHRAPDFRLLWRLLSFVLLLSVALPLEKFTLTFRGTGLVLFILKWLSSLCSHGHCFWRWSLDLSPFLLTNSVFVMWGGHN